MKIKDLLRIIFRIFGLYSVINLSFTFFPAQIAITYLSSSGDFLPFDSDNGIMQTWIYLVVVLLLITAVFYLLIINPDIIINKLKPKSFLEVTISFDKLNPESLLQIAILSIGILMLFESIPTLINKLFLVFKMNKMREYFEDNFNTNGLNFEIITESVKVLLGLIFIIFQNQIGKVLYRQNVK
ncbi:hypothetical protein AB4Y90_05040 [Chryseobacterium sp. 2TAF14]|uniref:hypothetical protein n=1 Tax=Chryseobacterium sp. 2TAF14 TaxID=3233007 RepID=UPI003F901A44